MKIDQAVFNYLPEDDPKAMLIKSIGDKYGRFYIWIIGLETAEVFTRGALGQRDRESQGDLTARKTYTIM